MAKNERKQSSNLQSSANVGRTKELSDLDLSGIAAGGAKSASSSAGGSAGGSASAGGARLFRGRRR